MVLISHSPVDLYLKEFTLHSMPFRRSLQLRPVKTEKTEITWSDLSADYGTANVNKTIATPGTNNMEVGDTVRWVYFELNIAAEEITTANVVHWSVIKLRTGQSVPAGTTYDNAIKSQVLKRGMEMLPKDVATVYKRVFVVRLPRSIRRFRDGDSLVLSFRATLTLDVNSCGFAIFRTFK